MSVNSTGMNCPPLLPVSSASHTRPPRDRASSVWTGAGTRCMQFRGVRPTRLAPLSIGDLLSPAGTISGSRSLSGSRPRTSFSQLLITPGDGALCQLLGICGEWRVFLRYVGGCGEREDAISTAATRANWPVSGSRRGYIAGTPSHLAWICSPPGFYEVALWLP